MLIGRSSLLIHPIVLLFCIIIITIILQSSPIRLVQYTSSFQPIILRPTTHITNSNSNDNNNRQQYKTRILLLLLRYPDDAITKNVHLRQRRRINNDVYLQSKLFQSSQQSQQQSSSFSSSTSSSSSSLPPVVTVDKVTCSYNGGQSYQLYDVSYILQRTSKVALVGRNGAGKSTLLKIIAETVGALNNNNNYYNNDNIKYTGQVTFPKDIRIAFVEQEPPTPSDITVRDALLGITSLAPSITGSNTRSTSVYEAVRRYRLAVQNAEMNPEEFTIASSEMNRMDGWDVLTKCDEIATKLRVYHCYDQMLNELSGGERKRVALATALIQEPDVLLLDEPTNYLSLAGVQWLANLLKNTPRLTILMVTHDRAFLDDVCDRVLELDDGKLYEYMATGTRTSRTLFDDYIDAKRARWEVEDATIQAAKAKYRIELDWMRRQPQARQTKSKSRIDAFYILQKATKPKVRIGELQIQTENDSTRRIGGKILSVRNVNYQISSEKIILHDFSYDFCKGDRICIAGANGVGKTTFLKILAGDILPDSGSIEIGDTIVLGIYDQLGITIDKTNQDQTALEYVREFCNSQIMTQQSSKNNNNNNAGMDEARKLLKQFDFPKERWNERISILSGGERRRIQLLSVISQRPNFLIMDEPSVDLDINTLQALENYLINDYKGVLVLVSHDRYFADKVTDHLFVFEGNGEIKDFQGSLSDYAMALIELEETVGSGNSNSNNKQQLNDSSTSLLENNNNYNKNNNIDKGISFKEQKTLRNEQRNRIRQARKEMDTIDSKLEKLKIKATELEKEIEQSNDKGWSVLSELTDKLTIVNEDIANLEFRWMELAEQVEEAEQIATQ